MGKLKGAGKPPSPPRTSGELSHLEFELQIHRDETNARLKEMQASIQDSLAVPLASFRSMLMDDLKAQRYHYLMALFVLVHCLLHRRSQLLRIYHPVWPDLRYMEAWHITFSPIQKKYALAWPQFAGCWRP